VDISALLLSCSVHVDDALLTSIAYVQSAGAAPLVRDVNPETFARGDDPPAREPSQDQRATIERILAIGGEPVFGVLPLRPEWASEFGKTLDALFDPCTAISVASAKLSEADYACRRRGAPSSPPRRACALDAYGAALNLPALRRAVLADLTLPSPVVELTELLASVSAAAPTPAPPSGLFFALQPLAPAARLEPDSATREPKDSR
jgi:hypothetical protein